MSTASPSRQKPRRDNRQTELLEAAAYWFNEVGYDEASMRDIATMAKMLPGSMYYHFASKRELFSAVFEVGMKEITDAVEEAIGDINDPYQRLQAASLAHLEATLKGSRFVGVVVNVVHVNDEAMRSRIAGWRANYEDIFRQLIAELPLIRGTNRKYLRLALLGVLNCCRIWYHQDGDEPAVVNRKILRQFFGDPKREQV